MTDEKTKPLLNDDEHYPFITARSRRGVGRWIFISSPLIYIYNVRASTRSTRANFASYVIVVVLKNSRKTQSSRGGGGGGGVVVRHDVVIIKPSRGRS